MIRDQAVVVQVVQTKSSAAIPQLWMLLVSINGKTWGSGCSLARMRGFFGKEGLRHLLLNCVVLQVVRLQLRVGDSWTSECSPAHLGLPPGTTSSASSSGKVTHLWDSHLRSLISRRLSHFSFVLQAKTKGLSVICLESL